MAGPLQLRPLTRPELDVLVDWAAAEGWNPGLDDAEVFWSTDPDAFVGIDVDGELAGGGAIVSYDGSYGFMGLFIVREDLRHQGLGRELWHLRRDRLRARLQPGAAIEMDGVFAMQPFYAAGGFVLQHRDLRFEGVAASVGAPDVVELADVPFDEVDAYDRRHVAAPRRSFLQAWIDRPGGHAVGVVDDGTLRGFGVARPCRVGYKIGPLFADDATVAERLWAGLTGRVTGAPVFLDVPERNEAAMALARRHDLHEVFGCARMTLGPPPVLPWDEVFGVTTFELG